jgi:hypothetical protein
MKGLPRYIVVGYTAVSLLAAVPAGAGTLKCPPDSVKVGTVCIDTYEASVWSIAPTNTKLVKKVQDGTATLADLTKGGATQLAPAATCSGRGDYGANFPASGNWTPIPGSNPPSPGVYASSGGAGVGPCRSWRAWRSRPLTPTAARRPSRFSVSAPLGNGHQIWETAQHRLLYTQG